MGRWHVEAPASANQDNALGIDPGTTVYVVDPDADCVDPEFTHDLGVCRHYECRTVYGSARDAVQEIAGIQNQALRDWDAIELVDALWVATLRPVDEDGDLGREYECDPDAADFKPYRPAGR